MEQSVASSPSSVFPFVSSPGRGQAAALGSATVRPVPALRSRDKAGTGTSSVLGLSPASLQPQGRRQTIPAGKPGVFPAAEGRAGQGGARVGLAQPRLQTLAATRRGEHREAAEHTAPGTALLPWRQGRLSRQCQVDRY